jgi:plastocyanin
MKKLTLSGALGLLAAVALAACGSSSSSTSTTSATPPASTGSSSSGGGTGSGGSSGGASSSGGGGGETLKFSADTSALKYDQAPTTAKAGSVTIAFDNPSAIPHNVTIEDANGDTVGATQTISSSNASTTVNLKPGTYTFLCTVDSHAQAGMEGKLTVK